jgi:hypothetical protein
VRAQLIRGKGERICQIAPGQTPHAQKFKDFRPVPP